MNATQHAEQIVREATGCTSEQAGEAVWSLIDAGWQPPDLPSSEELLTTDQAAVSEPVPIDPEIVLVAHTDGACSGNPGPGGWAVVLSQNGRIIAEHSGGDPATTSNRMELAAIRETLQRVPASIKLKIVTDSALVIGWLSKGWKRNEPRIAALCAEIDPLLVDRNCTFEKIAGHRGHDLNERADRLAVAAIPRLPVR